MLYCTATDNGIFIRYDDVSTWYLSCCKHTYAICCRSDFEAGSAITFALPALIVVCQVGSGLEERDSDGCTEGCTAAISSLVAGIVGAAAASFLLHSEGIKGGSPLAQKWKTRKWKTRTLMWVWYPATAQRRAILSLLRTYTLSLARLAYFPARFQVGSACNRTTTVCFERVAYTCNFCICKPHTLSRLFELGPTRKTKSPDLCWTYSCVYYIK